MFDDGDFAEPPNGFTGAGLSAYERSVSSIQSSDMLTRDEVAAARASYWACVAHLDNEIGQLIEELETLGLRENTVVIVDADHGTMLGEHGMWQKHVFNRASHRVPLIISAPGHLDPCRRSDINEILDRIRTVQAWSESPPDQISAVAICSATRPRRMSSARSAAERPAACCTRWPAARTRPRNGCASEVTDTGSTFRPGFAGRTSRRIPTPPTSLWPTWRLTGSNNGMPLPRSLSPRWTNCSARCGRGGQPAHDGARK